MNSMRLLPLLLALTLSAQTVSDRARRLHDSALVFDGHIHMVNRQFYNGGDIGERVADGHVDLSRLKEGGADAIFFTIFTSEEYYPGRHEVKMALRLMDKALSQIEKNSARIGIAYKASDIERLNREGRIAAVLDLEGGYDMEGDLGVLRMLYRLGLRSFQLPAHNYRNELADSCCAPQKHGGLTEQGRAVIREANRLGMMINASHGSQETIQQTAEVSSDPILLTHEGLRVFNDIPRTLTEETVRKVAKKGGLIGFHIGNEFHNRPQFDHRTKGAGKPFWDRSDVEEGLKGKSLVDIDRMVAPSYPMVGIDTPPELIFSVDDWFRVVDKVIEWAGEDHIMLGTDFDGGPTLPRGMRDVRDYPMLTEAMLRRGYSEARIRKFLGGNLMRVFRQVTEQ
jgi:membrane dipeptidase